MTIEIRNWDKHFEVAQSRKLLGRNIRWVAFPVKHDGKTLRKILKRKDGGDIFAAFVLMVEVAAKLPVRGRLSDEDGDLTPEDLELKTGFNAQKFESAIRVLSMSDFKWLEDTGSGVGAEWEQSGSALPQQDRTGQDKTEEKINARSKPRVEYPPEFEELWTAYGKKGAKKTAHEEWKRLGPTIDPPDGWNWKTFLIANAVLYRSIVPWEEFKHTKDLERWLKSGAYDFDSRALCKQWGVQKRVDAAAVWRRYQEKRNKP